MKFWLLRARALIFFCLMLLGVGSAFAFDMNVVSVRALPPEAQQTLALIKQGGPFPYPRDGIVFGNYQHALPSQSRGYYHEYTVKTPGAHNRGAQRIVVGGNVPNAVYFYTNDHYATFQRIQE
jgi:ribonuclease T1